MDTHESFWSPLCAQSGQSRKCPGVISSTGIHLSCAQWVGYTSSDQIGQSIILEPAGQSHPSRGSLAEDYFSYPISGFKRFKTGSWDEGNINTLLEVPAFYKFSGSLGYKTLNHSGQTGCLWVDTSSSQEVSWYLIFWTNKIKVIKKPVKSLIWESEENKIIISQSTLYSNY